MSSGVSGKMTVAEAKGLATAYQEKHKCRWSEACLAIKKRHPEARAAFGAPPKEDR